MGGNDQSEGRLKIGLDEDSFVRDLPWQTPPTTFSRAASPATLGIQGQSD
jgi:hypothetical protein